MSEFLKYETIIALSRPLDSHRHFKAMLLRCYIVNSQERQRPFYGRWFYRCNSLYDVDNSNRLAPGKIREVKVPPQKK